MPDIDMDAIVDAVKARGVPAFVEQTGGGCATIYAGECVDEFYKAAAGPGWFEGPGWTKPRAARDDFYIGSDGEDEYTAEGPLTDAQIVEAIVQLAKPTEEP